MIALGRIGATIGAELAPRKPSQVGNGAMRCREQENSFGSNLQGIQRHKRLIDYSGNGRVTWCREHIKTACVACNLKWIPSSIGCLDW
jgi:hypothetical protein